MVFFLSPAVDCVFFSQADGYFCNFQKDHGFRKLRWLLYLEFSHKKTIPDECAIPDMKETIEQLAPAVVYSPLNFLKAFYQIINSLRAKEKLILATEFGNYGYNLLALQVLQLHSQKLC